MPKSAPIISDSTHRRKIYDVRWFRRDQPSLKALKSLKADRREYRALKYLLPSASALRKIWLKVYPSLITVAVTTESETCL